MLVHPNLIVYRAPPKSPYHQSPPSTTSVSIQSQFSNNRVQMIPATLLLLLLITVPLPSSSAAPSAYEALAGFNFPAGLLPKGVTAYELDESTGKFRADLNGSCSFSLDGSYQLSYNSTITGRISDNRLTDLKGISVKVLFFWLNILEVVRSSDQLDFSVGISSASFPLDSFFVSPKCGCGLDCDSFRIRKFKSDQNPSFSSS